MANVVVNAMGDQCPIPVVKATKALKAMTEAGTVEIHVDNEVAVQNLSRMASKFGCKAASAKQEDKSALMKKFLESVSRWDDYTTASRYGWIEEVDDPSIYKQLQALRKADLELLTLIVVDGLSQTEIAAVLGCSPQNIFGRLKKIRKIFQK